MLRPKELGADLFKIDGLEETPQSPLGSVDPSHACRVIQQKLCKALGALLHSSECTWH